MQTKISETKDSVIVLSGGMDSVTLLHEYSGRIALAITFDYGCNQAAHEIACAAKNCDRLGIEHIVLRMPFIHDLFNSSLLRGGEAIPEGHYTSESMRSTVVPFRNGIMLAIAAGIADSRGLRGVLIADHSGDHAIYPDCRPEFVTAMDTAIKSGTDGQVALVAPYTTSTKADIARRGAQLGVDYSLTYSCYKGGDKHCGRCGTCVERQEAFREAGIEDPTIYEE